MPSRFSNAICAGDCPLYGDQSPCPTRKTVQKIMSTTLHCPIWPKGIACESSGRFAVAKRPDEPIGFGSMTWRTTTSFLARAGNLGVDICAGRALRPRITGSARLTNRWRPARLAVKQPLLTYFRQQRPIGGSREKKAYVSGLLDSGAGESPATSGMPVRSADNAYPASVFQVCSSSFICQQVAPIMLQMASSGRSLSSRFQNGSSSSSASVSSEIKV